MRLLFCEAMILGLQEHERGVKNQHTVAAPGLKSLYREVAKRVHPDFAIDELDRRRRERFMKEANAAHDKNDFASLRKVLHNYAVDAESERTKKIVCADANGWYRDGLSFWSSRKYEDAVRCFARGLQLDPNHASLQFYFGLAYYQGLGVPGTDYALAISCWRKAAEQGNAEAQNNLGQAYELGYGTEQDYRQAAYWFRKAAEQNHVTSLFNLGVMCELGHGMPQDLVAAASWYRKAAEQDYAPAQFNLGILYELGQGVPQDLARAAVWYREAVNSGEESAREALWQVLRKIDNLEQGGAQSGK
jgi:TPR repeat protein